MNNIILITFDSLRADHCGHHGYHRETTPVLDELASDGVEFRNANAPASRTNPSMSTIFTGEPLRNEDRVANPDNSRRHLRRHGTIANDLNKRGYSTGAFCPNAYASSYYGFDEGFDHFEDFLFRNETYRRLFSKHLNGSSMFTSFRNLRNYLRREEAFRTWDTYVDEIVDWVHAQSEPFFLWAFSMDTHFPYLTPRSERRWSNAFDQYYYNWRRNKLIDKFDVELSDREERKHIDIYDDSIRFADQFIAALQNRLDEFDPIFVVHADHGEALGGRGHYGHFYPSLYEEHIHVPLVVSGTNRTEAVTKPISLQNLRPMIKLLSDGQNFIPENDMSIMSEYDGRRKRRVSAVKTENWKYIREEGTDTRHELYNLDEDADEQVNIYDSKLKIAETLSIAADHHSHHRKELTEIERVAALMEGI